MHGSADRSYLLSSPIAAPADVNNMKNIDDDDDDDPLDICAPTAEQLAYCRLFVDDEEVCEVGFAYDTC